MRLFALVQLRGDDGLDEGNEDAEKLRYLRCSLDKQRTALGDALNMGLDKKRRIKETPRFLV